MEYVSQQQQENISQVVRAAGAQLLSSWKKGDTTGNHLEIITKPDGTNVTNADLQSNETILSGLKSIFPGDRVLSEEITPDADIDSAERVWVVDPLDGTQSFIEGRDDFSILLALTVKGIAVFSICYFPARDRFCISQTGKQAADNNQPITCSAVETPRPERIYVRGCEITDPPVKLPYRVDSGMAFLMIAKGELDGAVIRLNRLKQWDLAAPAALILGAGGKITDELGNDIKFSAHSFNYRYFIVSNGRCHDKVMKLVVS